MLARIKLLAALELKNLYGLNTLRHTKDKSVKRRALLLGITWLIVIAVVFFYVGSLAYGLVFLGLGSIVPAYLVMIASLLIFAFGIFKTGGVIFNRNGYDILASLPLPQESIVIGRFARMYVEDLLLTLAVLLPGGAVYAALARPGWFFYPAWMASAVLLPLLPLSAATLLGAVVAAISSRMKNKAAAESILSVAVVLAVFWGSTRLGASAETITPEMLADLAGAVAGLLGKLYPPALWLGGAMAGGSWGALVLGAAVSFSVFAAVAALAARNFHAVCRRLNVTAAKHDYRMAPLTESPVLTSLWRRELKRYFASGTYVANTIIGPIMGTVLAAACLFAGTESVQSVLGIELDIGGWMPFVLGGTFAMMPATAVSLSMEGKSWWITKSLPLTAKNVLDGKLLMNLSLMLPFYIVSQVLLVVALKPDGMELVWLTVIPALIVLFACVFGLTANLLLPNFNWDSEVSVVKQSAAALVGGFGGVLAAVLFAVAVALLPQEYSNAAKLVFSLLLLGATALLYRKNSSADLKKL